jgi:type IV fimbrial biogenesis protein FimT
MQSAFKSLHVAKGQRGLTLVELLIVIGIIAILVAVSVPSFLDFRNRSALKSAANEVQNVVDSARFEAIMRDRPVTVSFATSGDSVWCVGATEGRLACDCLELDNTAAAFCELDRYPAFDPTAGTAVAQAPSLLKRIEWFSAPSFGGQPFFTFDSKLGTLTDPAQFGDFGLATSGSGNPYRLQVQVNPLGGADICDVVHSGHPVFGVQPC